MEAAAAPKAQWTFAQKGIVVLAALQLLWALAGFVAEPSFQLGNGAPTERVLWVDFNGYHALAGLLLFGPAFYFALRPRWALYYAIYAAGALFVTGVWALFEEQPAWVFTFPNNTNDAIFHLVGAALFALVALIQIGRDRNA
jgi:predicted membrane channel-forming protein YqfA (hemolysin III family)